MMKYAFAIYYKDKEGFEHLHFDEETGTYLIFRDEKEALLQLSYYKNLAEKRWRPEPMIKTEGILWWKKTYNVSPKINPIDSALGRQIYNTIDVKKVKVV